MARSISLYVRAVPGVPPLLTVLHDRLEEGNSSYSQDSRWETVRRGGLQVETPTWEQGLKNCLNPMNQHKHLNIDRPKEQ